MPGRGHGRLVGSDQPSGPKNFGRGRGRGRASSIVTDDVTPVPFYTNTFGLVSKEQYNRNKLNKKLHPDDAGLGEFYVGSMPWHVRNQGRIWIPREQRPSRARPEKEVKHLRLPRNEDLIARDFDEISDEVSLASDRIAELFWAEFFHNKDDPKDPYASSNFFDAELSPQFPKMPPGKNPYDLLPFVQDGVYPFDAYGSKLFSSKTLDVWKNDPRAKQELFEVQFRQLVKINGLDRRPKIYSDQSESGSYGVQAPVYTGPSRFDTRPSKSDDQKPVGTSSNAAEPDSGFVSIEPSVDPWAGYSDKLPSNEYTWENVDGTGFVPLSTFLPNAWYAHTQVF